MKTPAHLFSLLLSLSLVVAVQAQQDVFNVNHGDPLELAQKLLSEVPSPVVESKRKPIKFREQGERLDSVVVSIFSNEEVVPFSKRTFLYDGDLNTHDYRYTWDSQSNHWQGDQGETFAYDDQGRLIFYDILFWDGTENQWKGQSRYSITYNEEGQITERLVLTWDELNGAWRNWNKYEYVYNAYNTFSVLKVYSWDQQAGNWWQSGLVESDYNEHGRLLNRDAFSFDLSSGTWNWSYQIFAEYNEEGQQDNYEFRFWDNVLGEFGNCYYFEHTYNELGQLIETTSYFRFGIDEEWESYRLYRYEHDDGGNNIIDNHYIWDSTTEGWGLNTTIQYEYDTECLTEGLILPEQLTFDSPHQLEQVTRGNYGSGVYSPSSEDVFYYSTGTTNVEDQLNAIVPLEVFPNPATTHLSIRTPAPTTLELFDAQGRPVLSQPINPAETVEIAHLPQGVYVYRLDVDGQWQTGRIVKL